MARATNGPIDEQWLPDNIVESWARAKKLAWWTIAYLASVIALLGFTMGSSQAMKTAWVDDALGLVPPIAFLVSARYTHRARTSKFPFGYHRASTIAQLAGALALVAMGGFLAVEAVVHLASRERVTIDHVRVLGRSVWRGWFMFAALAWSGIPAYFFGRAKRPLAEVLHDHGLLADAEMNRADWIAALAAAFGVVGIALRWWWADALAGGVIAIEIVRDGFHVLRRAVHTLMDRAPKGLGGGEDPLVERISRTVASVGWIDDYRVRLREHGHVIVGEVRVVPRDSERLMERLESLREELLNLDWRMHEVLVAPLRSLE